MAIPVRNIYYLLSYAWDRLDESGRVSVTVDDRTELLDLFAKILINATRILLKRGIDKNYVEKRFEISGIKGKLEMTETVKRSSLQKSRTFCTFDEYSANVLLNQILVSTLWRLFRTNGLDLELRAQIKSLLGKLGGIDRIHLRPSHFRSVRIDRNNKFYGFVIDVCRLVHENTLPSEEEGRFEFTDFTRDESKMNRLFEKFVFNFYRIEQDDFKVRVEQIGWDFEAGNEEDLRYLPAMYTDISLENEDRKIIIDTKFYKETLSKNYEAKKVHSSNLYQVFSYLINQRGEDKRNQATTGILLYPTIDTELDLEYIYKNHLIGIKTVNLNAPWKAIEARLREIVS